MKVEGVKITWVSADEAYDLRDRPGFVDPCCYGIGVPIEPTEAGAIAVKVGEPRFEHGVWATPCKYVERFFIVEPEPA